MTFTRYIQDRAIFLIVTGITYTILAGVLYFLTIPVSIIASLLIITLAPLLIYMTLQYLKQRAFYRNIEETLQQLEQKYLLSEVLGEQTTIEGQLLYDVLRETLRDMHEHVKYYKLREQEYREYIETWVHEIKTPIAASRLMVDNNRNDVTKMIDDELRQIEHYIEQALYYARSQHVNEDYMIKEVPLLHVVRNVVKKNARTFIQQHITVDVSDVTGTVYSDAKWLEFIVQQMISNATKYTADTNRAVRIYTTTTNTNVVLTIEDNGPGIAAHELSKVFQKGFTGENGRTFGKSTGIGLYLTKKLCDKLGLDVSITSTLGEGTAAHITFPHNHMTARAFR